MNRSRQASDDGRGGATNRLRWLGPLRGPVERFLAGGRVDDPFYLTNQTTGQKVRKGVLIALPFVLAITVAGISRILPRKTHPVAELTRAEVAARTLPDYSKTVRVPSNTEVQVVEVMVHRNPGPVVSGSVRNLTDREIPSAELVFDLTDSNGSQVGAVTGTVSRLKPNSVTKFQLPIKETNAAFALVREVDSH